MASRKRDYAAEYARAKAKAQAAGYKSQREYKRARAGLTGRVSPVPKTVRDKIRDADSKAWSNKHSKSPSSKFNTRWGRERRDAYYQVFVEPYNNPQRPKDAKDTSDVRWRKELHKILVPRVYSDAEFNERYSG